MFNIIIVFKYKITQGDVYKRQALRKTKPYLDEFTVFLQYHFYAFVIVYLYIVKLCVSYAAKVTEEDKRREKF